MAIICISLALTWLSHLHKPKRTCMTSTPLSSLSFHVLPTEKVLFEFCLDLWMSPLPSLDPIGRHKIYYNASGATVVQRCPYILAIIMYLGFCPPSSGASSQTLTCATYVSWCPCALSLPKIDETIRCRTSSAMLPSEDGVVSRECLSCARGV